MTEAASTSCIETYLVMDYDLMDDQEFSIYDVAVEEVVAGKHEENLAEYDANVEKYDKELEEEYNESAEVGEQYYEDVETGEEHDENVEEAYIKKEYAEIERLKDSANVLCLDGGEDPDIKWLDEPESSDKSQKTLDDQPMMEEASADNNILEETVAENNASQVEAYASFEEVEEVEVGAGDLEEDHDLTMLEEGVTSIDSLPGEPVVEDWSQPALPFSILVAIGILNTDSKQMTLAEIYAFLRDHFPYYNNKKTSENWHKLQCKHFQRGVNERGQSIFCMTEKHVKMTIRILKDTWQSYPNVNSRFYSISCSDLWPIMVEGQYRKHPDKFEYHVSDDEPGKDIHMRPAFSEKILLGIAMTNLKNKGNTFLELCAFIEYYFPFLRTDRRWKEVAFERLTTPLERNGMFTRCRDGKNILFAVPQDKWREIDRAIENLKKVIALEDRGFFSGLVDRRLWGHMLNAKLEYSAVPASLIEKIREEIKPIEEKAQEEKLFADLKDSAGQKLYMEDNVSNLCPLQRIPRNSGYGYLGSVYKKPDGTSFQVVYSVYKPENFPSSK